MSDYPPPPGSSTPPGGPVPPPPPGWGVPPPPTGQSFPPPGPARTRPGELLDRFVARFVDVLLVGVVNALVGTAVVVGIFGMDGGSFGYGASVVSGIISAVLSTVIALGYYAVMESRQGRTVGKMVMRLQVQDLGGGHPTVEQSIKRNIWVAVPLLGILPVVGGLLALFAQVVAVITIAVGINNDRVARRPWTDKLAGTRVLKEG